jgi:hypothetical protein
MSLNEIKTKFAGCHDDAESAAFYKKWMLVKGETNARLVRLILTAHADKFPGCSAPSNLSRCTKLELVRHLAWVCG